MTQTISFSPSPASRGTLKSHGLAPARSRSGRHQRGDDRVFAARSGVVGRGSVDPLGRYADATGRSREVIAVRRGDGCVLVVDRDSLTLGDRRLVAELAVDEPAENAALVCALYLRDARRGRCRRVTIEDLTGKTRPEGIVDARRFACQGGPLGRCEDARANVVYRLELTHTEAAARELRWCRHSRRGGGPAASTPVCLRAAIGALESYEPVCALTHRALAQYRHDASVSTAVLRGELERLRESPIVLNRGLRQTLLAAIERHGLSLSEIAIRCGRVKRDVRGNASGETSWLARRVGILPESGASRPTPWVHSDVLALIARNGLGISPREVELG